VTVIYGKPNWPNARILTTSLKGGSGSVPAAALFSAWMVFRHTFETRLELVSKNLLPLDFLTINEDSEGYLHHDTLPSWESEYEAEYYSHGYAHRVSGPAIINKAAEPRYFLYGVTVSEVFHEKVIELSNTNDIPVYIAYCLVRTEEERVPDNINDLVQLPIDFAVKALGANIEVLINSQTPFKSIAEDERARYIATH
jgi:hypothetical protein